ncbi:unnamed protein product [Moneuplotes crassus]|uniref:Uncharacterized protein n=1 Tax=Euplotes crassus TaxID=5936 RepID=A0AAD1X2S2_EUPCR|nr:unnamed protein product [Moneuplotes crassus]
MKSKTLLCLYRISLSDTHMLYYSKSSSHLPVVEFKLTEGSPCINAEELYHTTSKFNKLSKSDKSGCNTILGDNIIFDERYRFVTSESNYEMVPPKAHWGRGWGKASTMNLYQKSYVRWNSECYNSVLSPEETFVNIDIFESVAAWQSVFSQISLVDMVVTFVFGVVSLIDMVKRLFFRGKSGKWVKWFDNINNEWTMLINFTKIVFAYFCVSYIDLYESDIIEVSVSTCSDKITNHSFEVLGNSLLDSRDDDITVLKITILMLAFEVTNYLLPNLLHLRKHQQKQKLKKD